MSKLSVFGVCALALALSAPTARAQAERKAGDVPGPIDSLQDLQDTGRMVFKMADTNNDGQISQQEAQTARQVFMSKIRALNLPEPANSPRHVINSALGSQTAPSPAPATPAAPPAR